MNHYKQKYNFTFKSGGKNIRCHLVTEDVTETKRCNPLKTSQLISGLKLGQFKVLLGTLAQFHAVGIAWTLGSKDDSLLDLFPFLHKTDSDDVMKRQQHLNNYQRLLELHYDTDSRQVHLFKVSTKNKGGMNKFDATYSFPISWLFTNRFRDTIDMKVTKENGNERNFEKNLAIFCK